MEIRTTAECIELHQPFTLKCRVGKLPPGRYLIELHEERFEGLSYPAWRCSSMTIASTEGPLGEPRDKLPLTPGELADLLNADAGS